jgi:hypothetical protein
MFVEPTLPPLYRSEAFFEDLESDAEPIVPPAAPPALLALLPAVVALASGAATFLARAA